MLDTSILGLDSAHPSASGPAMPAATASLVMPRPVRIDDTDDSAPWWKGLDDDIYLSPHEAAALAGRCGAVSERWSQLAADPASRRPLAILARQIATPNYETLWFLRLASRRGFQPAIIEHRSDRFTVNNAIKCHLGRLPIVVGRSRNGRIIIRRQKLLDPTEAEGRPLGEIRTQAGELLIEYHHRKLRQILEDEMPNLIDMSEAVESWKLGPRTYYVEFFRQLVGPIALFEDFVVDERTARFFQQVVRPAFEQATAEAGQRPQIIKLTPGPQMSSSLWSSYPAAMAEV